MSFWALFRLAAACPHLFPPGMKSSASASLVQVLPGKVSIGSYFGAPKGARRVCCMLRGVKALQGLGMLDVSMKL